MTRFRIRQDVVEIQPAPGTILPGVPLVGRDAGPLFPVQRVHDPLSAADRSALVLSEVLALEAAVERAQELADSSPGADVNSSHNGDPSTEVGILDAGDSSLDTTFHVAGPSLDEVPAIDEAFLEAVVRRRPLPIHPSSASMAQPPAPERVKLMVGVLARDFERFGARTAAPAPSTSVPSTAKTEPAADSLWGPWPEPHTSAWPVVVPPWGQIPRSFAYPRSEVLTRSA